MLEYQKPKIGKGRKKSIFNESISIIDIIKELRLFKRELYLENVRGFTKSDPRWETFYMKIAQMVTDKIRAKIISRLSSINQIDGMQRFPNCKQCIFWKKASEDKGKSDPSIRMCTNPKFSQGLFSFNPNQCETKQQIIDMAQSQFFYTHKHHGCLYGSRTQKIKGLRNL
jgi:hypothetical protein